MSGGAGTEADHDAPNSSQSGSVGVCSKFHALPREWDRFRGLPSKFSHSSATKWIPAQCGSRLQWSMSDHQQLQLMEILNGHLCFGLKPRRLGRDSPTKSRIHGRRLPHAHIRDTATFSKAHKVLLRDSKFEHLPAINEVIKWQDNTYYGNKIYPGTTPMPRVFRSPE
ncbi:hypothetical protein PAXINDRAFT_154178 [Paxillus involutus ATCC 200175]|nr:hypothetical protein PAXINDRAFT_154178 [Paxillus involutus ATCC 200175]